MSTYLFINVLSISVPLLFSFHPRLKFYKQWYAVFTAIIIPGVIFILWDILFTRWGVWGFTPSHLSGVYWFRLPIEEWLFFICIPYACVFTYASLSILVKKDFMGSYAKPISWMLLVVLVVIALINNNRIYTSVTFLGTASFLLFHLLILKSDYLGRFYLAYLVIYIFPFLIVNGILTGSFLTEPVVWYNNAENLSLRIFTIPVEDFVYGMLLYLMNVTVYEKLMTCKKLFAEEIYT
jgi:lycopene cyclase domain-containing protein